MRPGHVLPLRARDGGVLRRPGHTEAAVDLSRLARLAPFPVSYAHTNPLAQQKNRPFDRRPAAGLASNAWVGYLLAEAYSF